MSDKESDCLLCRKLWAMFGTSRRVPSVLMTAKNLFTSIIEQLEVAPWFRIRNTDYSSACAWPCVLN